MKVLSDYLKSTIIYKDMIQLHISLTDNWKLKYFEEFIKRASITFDLLDWISMFYTKGYDRLHRDVWMHMREKYKEYEHLKYGVCESV